MQLTPLEKKIADIASPLAVDLGLEVVHVSINGAEGTKIVQIMAEDPATGNLLVDKAAELSRALSAHMDVEDPIDGAYRLEVSSPGIDRVLTRKKDFEVYKTFEAKLERQMPDENGQKRFRGYIKGIDDKDIITLETDNGPAHIAFGDLAKAKLVMTDELLKRTANKKA